MVNKKRQHVQWDQTHSTHGVHPRGLPQVYRGRARKAYRDIYDCDQASGPQAGRFRWLMSTCLAAMVGGVAIIAVIYGSTEDTIDATVVMKPAWHMLEEGTLPEYQMPQVRRAEGLNWTAPKTDSLQVISGATSTRYLIHDSLKQRRSGREYIYAKPYARIVARLSRDTSAFDEIIPPFNPFKLYADDKPVTANNLNENSGGTNDSVKVRVVELLGGILPGEDGQELNNNEVAELVVRAEREELGPGELRYGINEGEPNSQLTNPLQVNFNPATAFDPRLTPPNTTILQKSVHEMESTFGDVVGRQKRIVSVGVRDTLENILESAGANTVLIESMTEPLKTKLSEGQEIHITLEPSLTNSNFLEPTAFSIFNPGHVHIITIRRGEAGLFVAHNSPFDPRELAQAGLGGKKNNKKTSIYRSIYHAALLQNLAPETIMKILRVHAYDTDFHRRLGAGDSIELFFDIKSSKEAKTGDDTPGELLYSNVNAGGKDSRFYRFRTADGIVDFYDEKGNNSKRFLMRKPVRSSDVRLTSGFGLRYHPLLNRRRMHNGVDWAARTGTPILAAGNGTVEHAGRRGHYGKYVRIRHANGYETAYGHMSRFAKGVRKGVKVRQGQVIGYIGSTGLSSGPHLHFEVLVNKRFVNPMSIRVPRARQLKGEELAEFQKERARIDALMQRAPVMTASK